MPRPGYLQRVGDLAACILVAVAMLASSAFSVSNAVTAVLGGLLVLVVPGYALTALMWTGEDSMTAGDRVIFTVGLSVSLAVFSVLFLSVSGVGIYPLTITLLLAYEGLAFSLLAVALRLARRQGIPPDLTEFAKAARSLVGRDRPFWTLVGILLVSGAVIVALIVSTPSPPPTIQFYVLGPDGTTSTLPTTVVANRTSSILVGVFNGEGGDIAFTVTVCLSGGNASCPGPPNLNVSWSSILPLVPNGTYALNLSARAGARAEVPLQFVGAVPGAYTMSLSLDGGGVHRDARFPLRVTT